MPPSITMEFEGDKSKIREDSTAHSMGMASMSSAAVCSDAFPDVFEEATSNESMISFYFEDSKCDTKRSAPSFYSKEDDGSVSSTSSDSSLVRMPTSPLHSACTFVDPIVDTSIYPDSSGLLLHTEKFISRDNKSPLVPSAFAPSNESTDAPSSCQSKTDQLSFLSLRGTYLLVTLVIMLADGLQGTHLYVLYEGYGYSVSYLYCLGFATGGLMSPITGPLVDKIGRKKSAILYCCLEMLINYMEQHPYLWGLIMCRVIGGFTTNLLSSVFETWLDTEYRRRGFAKEKYEIIMRDSVIASNVAAIFSGYLSHVLATRYGTVGPFEGAVTCTAVALAVVCFVWTENYGSSDSHSETMMGYFKEAVSAFRNDRKMLTIGVLQGLTTGSIHIFIFLWAPTLRNFARTAPPDTWGVDLNGEPAYGLIFGAFMAAGVAGGLVAPRLRRFLTALLSPIVDESLRVATVEIEGEGNVAIRPMAVEFLASSCYFFSALLLFVPWICSDHHAKSFTNSLVALLFFEFMIGVFMPCEGVIRSLYFPSNARASIMTLPRIIVNAAVAVGVLSTNYITLNAAFFAVGCLMTISGVLQLSLISNREWSCLFSRFNLLQDQCAGKVRSLSFVFQDLCSQPPLPSEVSRRVSACTDISETSEVCDPLEDFCHGYKDSKIKEE